MTTNTNKPTAEQLAHLTWLYRMATDATTTEEFDRRMADVREYEGSLR